MYINSHSQGHGMDTKINGMNNTEKEGTQESPRWAHWCATPEPELSNTTWSQFIINSFPTSIQTSYDFNYNPAHSLPPPSHPSFWPPPTPPQQPPKIIIGSYVVIIAPVLLYYRADAGGGYYIPQFLDDGGIYKLTYIYIYIWWITCRVIQKTVLCISQYESKNITRA